MKINTPFDALPTEEGEYIARLDVFTLGEAHSIRNRRYFENGKWSGPYFVSDHALNYDEIKRARSQTSMFNLYWMSK